LSEVRWGCVVVGWEIFERRDGMRFNSFDVINVRGNCNIVGRCKTKRNRKRRKKGSE